MKVVVFGGSGFLGSHVADSLSERGYDVYIFDVIKSPYLKENQKMVIGDILIREQIMDVARDAEYLFNFAGFADLDTAKTKPVDTVNLNILGNINIMEAAVKAKVKRIIYASTIYVYSEKGGFYRCSKQASELYIEEFQRRFGINYTILRFGTLYGTRADERNSVYRYLLQALNEKKIVALGTGDEIREYINVKDAAKLSVDVLDESYENRHIIITGHHPMRYSDMLLMIKEILGGGISLEYHEVSSEHYSYTPYSFVPKIGNKLVSHEYLDMGQGLLECLHEMYEKKDLVNKPCNE